MTIMKWLLELLDPVQLIGYAGMLCAVLSYQCKKNQTYFFFQILCSTFFMVQFILLGSWAGMIMNVFGIYRGVILYMGKKCEKMGFLISIQVCFVISAVVSVVVFNEMIWIAVLLFLAQAGGTLAMWSRDGRIIRGVQVFVASPAWIINNICYFSMGGILCEVFNIVSVLVSVLRFRKTGFDKA